MQVGQSKFGMQTLNQSLCGLYLKRLITLEDCLGRSSDVDELKAMIAAAQTGGPGSPPGSGMSPTYGGPRPNDPRPVRRAGG